MVQSSVELPVQEHVDEEEHCLVHQEPGRYKPSAYIVSVCRILRVAALLHTFALLGLLHTFALLGVTLVCCCVIQGIVAVFSTCTHMERSLFKHMSLQLQGIFHRRRTLFTHDILLAHSLIIIFATLHSVEVVQHYCAWEGRCKFVQI